METSAKTDKTRSPTAVSYFLPLVAPMIESTSHSALVEWKRKRKEYEEEVAVRCGHDQEKIEKMTTSIYNSFSKSLLSVLCDLEWGISKEEATEELLLGKIEAILSTVKNNTVPDVAAEFKAAVRMDLQETDVRERVVQFFRLGRQVIEEHGWSEFFEDQEGRKLKCKLLVASLEPQPMREEIEAILAYQNRAAWADERALFKIIVEKALEHERDFLRRKRQRETSRCERQRSRTVDTNRPRKKGRFKVEVDKPTASPPASLNTTERPEKQLHQEKHGGSSKKPDGGCLKCKGDHWLVRCPVATHEEKTTLLRQQHERRNRVKAEQRRVVQE